MDKKCVLQLCDNLNAACQTRKPAGLIITMGAAADFQELNENTTVTWRRFTINVCQLSFSALKNGQNTAQF